MNTLVLLLSAVSLVRSVDPNSLLEPLAPLQALESEELLAPAQASEGNVQEFLQSIDTDESDEENDLLQDSDDDIISILEDLTEIIFDFELSDDDVN